MAAYKLGQRVTYLGDKAVIVEVRNEGSYMAYIVELDETGSRWRAVDRELKPLKGASKYRNVSVNDPEHGRFDSQAEYARWCELLLLQEAGEISNLKRQVSLELIRPIEGDDPRIKPVRYKVDFTYYEMDSLTGIKKFVAEEVKGMWTPEARLKAYLFMLKYPHIKYVVTGTQL